MQINPAKEQELIAAGVAGGLDEFKVYLGRRVHLPYERWQWPNLDYIRVANKIRGIL
jgi:putative restriction endonuclease